MGNNYPNFDKEDARSIPLKYIGYRVFSQWVATDQSFFVVRRFGALGARVALSLQDKVVMREEELEALDKESSRKDENDSKIINNGTFRDDIVKRRRELIEDELPDMLTKYYSFIDQYSQLVARPRVEPYAISNIRRWFKNHDCRYSDGSQMPAIDDVEAAYIRGDHTDDLIPIQPKIKSPIRRFLERSVLLRVKGSRKVFERRPVGWDQIDPTDDGKDREGITILGNDKTIDRAAAASTAVSCLVMLVGPLWILEYVQGITARPGVITGFVALLFVTMALATTAKMSEAIAATAAYSAVLTVFLTLGSDR